METYVTDPWGCSQSPTLLLDTTGKSSDAITSDFEGGKGTVLTPAEPIRQNVSFSQNGYLTVGFRGKGDLNKAINVCYIKITDASLENPDNYVKDDLADLYFSTYCLSDNLTLPTQGKNGSVITWSSSNTSVITADGKVTRPDVGQEDKKVTLTATVSYGTTVQSKKFDFTVYAKGGLTKAEQFALNDVTLTDTYYKAAESSDLSFLKKFDNDRLLSRFRETAGVDQKGASPYKGWEDSLIGGHCVGHYLTACAQAVKATGDESLRTKLTALISGLRECQTKLNTGFVFGARIDDASNVEKQFDIVEGKDSGNTWVPWYTMHKIVQGLVDVYRYTDNQEALTVAKDLGEWIYNRVNQWDSGTQARISYTEYGGMNDCMYELYKITGNTHFRDAAHKFDDPGLYKTILSGNSNTLNKRHANTTIPKFVGALNRYVALTERGETLTEDDKAYLGYAEDFWKLVVEKHAFITGSVSDMEHFKEDHAQDSIRTQCNCESCCVHNMLKLSKELF